MLKITGDTDDFNRGFVRLQAAFPDALRRVAAIADVRIGARSVGTYMRNAKGEGRRKRTDTGPLRSVSARLARAMQSRPSPAGREYKLTVNIAGAMLSYAKEVYVPYAFAHEKGGEWDVPITQKSRKFFWYMWYTTRDDMWRGMALTKKTKLHIVMPARPYAEPAVVQEVGEIASRAAGIIVEVIKKAYRL